MSRGLFIVIEGLDRCGKTTQLDILKNYLQPSKSISFPNESLQSGMDLRKYLLQQIELTDMDAHNLFARNRRESADFIIQTIEKNINVISSRYAFSGVAYTTQKGFSMQDAIQADKGILIPDLTIILTCDVQNIQQRFDNKDRYENIEVQEKVKQKFKEVLMLKNIGNICNIDITGMSIQQVKEQILHKVDQIQHENNSIQMGLFEGNY
ncbi:Thymidylate kinase [Spironucleus salmonicida]|uniref:dTMP kinase n=1 Tax=Spironucleus salmonicida TaxID=348837 RepID=V6LIR3_9EUKA|nr:Thymidylate kinase [Spironucleus salmonicida]|eukprot:EST44447.1 Thymidylate kinase [Spironucleus salmonicida]